MKGTLFKLSIAAIWILARISAAESLIQTQPKDVNAAIGSTVTFTVVPVFSGSVVKWYKSGNANMLKQGTNLTFNNVQVGNVGYYYCTVGSQEVPSNLVALMLYGPTVTSMTNGVRVASLPVYCPYPGGGGASFGPCGQFFGMVQLAKPQSGVPDYVWVPPDLKNRHISVGNVLGNSNGFQYQTSIIQSYPPKRFCGVANSKLGADINKGAGCLLQIYALDAAFSSGVIQADVSWNPVDGVR
ncbi:MAG: immunoglobulin domain-containing protein [Verrucomicrobiales bacterium]|nr:immunoglobulin domain-containing protein [Verrucomicrobiales bacterium]